MRKMMVALLVIGALVATALPAAAESQGSIVTLGGGRTKATK